MVASAEKNDNGSDTTRKGSRGNWRNYAVTIVGLAVICGAATVVGQYSRAGEATTVEPPSGAVGTSDATKLDLPVKPTVPVTLTVYEDPRSPESRAFAQQYASTFSQLLASGQVEINYRLVTGSDRQYGGTGAQEAAEAAACAQDQGRFPQFMDQLWQHQPDPKTDGLKDRKLLKQIAKKAGKIEHDTFDLCLDRNQRQGWVKKSQETYAASGLGPVPVVQLNGHTLADPATQLTPKKLTALVTKEARQVAAAAPASPAPSATPTP
ncbi:DsbA family protein [Streptomyces yunnanensis]|uniref:DsbA family protein n=1 Tax=Streptomyces yunnanensis TaxID=156453 RepID=A0ABY8AMX7_9ACTN|nr:thioredoxin domain-containing protein [Streptomyces yunnanensis]WEB44942.1 DsbA family protein [Streptomyces yunnanensis]